jgi:hypothetical protein
MRPPERAADKPNYGTSAPPLVFIKFRGPKAHDDRPKKEGEIPRFAVESEGSRRWDP